MAQKVEGNSKVNDVTNVEGEWVRKRGMKMGGGNATERANTMNI